MSTLAVLGALRDKNVNKTLKSIINGGLTQV